MDDGGGGDQAGAGEASSPSLGRRVRLAARRTGAALQRLDTAPQVVALARAVRRRLPGDPEWGDPLSTGGVEPAHLLGQRVVALRGQQPSASSEVAMSALQLWRNLPGRAQPEGEQDVALLFTDLVGFSSWALTAGDDATLDLLRRVGTAVEPQVTGRSGAVVKRLGDGLMAVFREPTDAVDAGLAAIDAVAELRAGDVRPRLRAGVHAGRALRLGSDYFGVDVNVAARVGAAAGPDELLVSTAVRDALPLEQYRLKRKWRFSADGVPPGTQVYRVQRDPAGG